MKLKHPRGLDAILVLLQTVSPVSHPSPLCKDMESSKKCKTRLGFGTKYLLRQQRSRPHRTRGTIGIVLHELSKDGVTILNAEEYKIALSMKWKSLIDP